MEGEKGQCLHYKNWCYVGGVHGTIVSSKLQNTTTVIYSLYVCHVWKREKIYSVQSF